MRYIFILIINLICSLHVYSQDPAKETEASLELLTDSPVQHGEYKIHQTSPLKINGEPFIKLEFEPKTSLGSQSLMLKNKPDAFACHLDEHHVLGHPVFKTSYIALNIGSSLLMYNNLKQAEWDKAKHFYAGYIIGNVTSGGFQLLLPKDTPHRKLKIFMAGVVASAIVGAGKEIRDSYGYGNPEAKDAYATLLGGVGGSITFSLVDLKKHKKLP